MTPPLLVEIRDKILSIDNSLRVVCDVIPLLYGMTDIPYAEVNGGLAGRVVRIYYEDFETLWLSFTESNHEWVTEYWPDGASTISNSVIALLQGPLKYRRIWPFGHWIRTMSHTLNRKEKMTFCCSEKDWRLRTIA